MDKLHTTNINSKEKELALSLLRIPLNFFSEDTEKSDVTTKTDSESEKTNQTPASNSSKSIQIEIQDDKNTRINLSQDLDATETTSSTIKNNKTANNSSTFSEPTPSEENNDTESTQEEITTSSPQPSQQESTTPNQPPLENTSSAASSDKKTTPAATSNNSVQTSPSHTTSSPSSAPSKEQNTPQAEEKNAPEDEPRSENSVSGDTPHSDEKSDTNNPEKNKSEHSPSSSPEKKDSEPKSSNPKEKSDMDKKVDDLKKRLGKKIPGKANLDAKKQEAQKKLADKIAQNPKMGKALGALNKVNDVKNTVDNAREAVQDLNTEKMAEAVGDAAVKGLAAGGDAIVPGLGKAVDAVDKTVGQSEMGKKAKKAIGSCTCFGCLCGCLVPVLLLVTPVMFISNAFSWVTNLFGKDNTAWTEGVDTLTVSEQNKLLEAYEEHSMQGYTDLTTELYNDEPGFLEWFFGTYEPPEYPIQSALEKYIDKHYIYDAGMVADYYSKYGDLIDKGYLMPVNVGDLTSFGMAFEVLKSNYTVHHLKAPSSAPKRVKIINGEKIIYTTYDPTGMHQALFEDVLKNSETLKNRFSGQVDEEWFKELGMTDEDGNPLNPNSILDKKFNVYIDELDETRSLSLRDLFIETSKQLHDTEYHAMLVNTVFSKDTGTNKDILTQYNELVKRLSMLELMTYMLAYQKFYEQVDTFLEDNAEYININMFDPKQESGEQFWAQFLTFSNVEHYLALSSLSDHSMAYEIGVASIDSSTNAIDVTEIQTGNQPFIGIRKFENWYATYTFTPTVTTNGTTYTYNVSNPPPTVELTEIQAHLFDKYNVGFGLFNSDPSLTEEEIERKNQNTFFALFETATGIQMAEFDENGQLQTPIYKLDEEGIPMGPAIFPIDMDRSLARITMNHNQPYSLATVERYNMTHRNHIGMDIAVPTGTEVKASSSGTAYVTRGNTGYGNYVKIIHDDGYTSIYAHGNGTFYINNGARVSAGQPIMQSGNSGNSTGPHLHFEVRDSSGSPVNPTSYIYGNA